MSGVRPNTFKIAQLNAENLFLFLDEAKERDWRSLSEKEWQKLSNASVPNKSLVKTLWLAESLLEINADLVFISEVGGIESLSHFAKFFLGDRYIPHLIEGNSDRGIDVGFLIRRDFPLNAELRTHKDRALDFHYPHEDPPKTHYFSRDCAELRLYRPGETTPALIALSVHLKSKLDPEGIDPEGRDRREAELKLLVEIYKELRLEFSPPIPIIVAGDFNGCARRSNLAPEFQSLTTTDLESVADILDRDDEASATQLQFNRSQQIQCLQIDYIFISPELKGVLNHEESGVFRYRSELKLPLPLPTTLDQRLHLPSDHYPVFATFKNIF